MRTSEDFEKVRRLIAAGVNDCEISRRTGVPRPTVRDWRCRPPATRRCPTADAPCGIVHDSADLPVKDYCYLFGLYLGDGCISRMNRVWKLRISLDKKYPGIIDSCRSAINAVMPGQHASIDWQPQGCAVVGLYSKHRPCRRLHPRTDPQ